MLTLPICSWIKDHLDDAQVLFLGKGYTKSVVEAFEDVDQFHDWAEVKKLDQAGQKEYLRQLNLDTIIHVFPSKEIAKLAKAIGIEHRIGTSHRLFHLTTCNERVSFTRKRSNLHESQLNYELLRPLGLEMIPSLEQIIATTQKFKPSEHKLPQDIKQGLSAERKVILHAKSQGSAVEWPMEKYLELAKSLASKGVTVYFTGTDSEGSSFRHELPDNPLIIDTTGKLSLEELMYFISRVDALVACSTGPLHIAGYTGIKTIGLFSTRRPIHPGRWKALGENVQILVNDPSCATCMSGKECDCISKISVDRVLDEIG